MQTQLVIGSLGQIAAQNKTSIAETFIGADAVIIVDVSGSMNQRDSRGGRPRYDVALEELARLQKQLPGKLAVICFSSTVQFVPGGLPPMLDGGTDLAGALKFAKIADVPGVRFVVISDGEPNSQREALDAARAFTNRIDTIYVGPEDDTNAREFLRELAEASGGVHVEAARVLELAARVQLLLSASA